MTDKINAKEYLTSDEVIQVLSSLGLERFPTSWSKRTYQYKYGSEFFYVKRTKQGMLLISRDFFSIHQDEFMNLQGLSQDRTERREWAFAGFPKVDPGDPKSSGIGIPFLFETTSALEEWFHLYKRLINESLKNEGSHDHTAIDRMKDLVELKNSDPCLHDELNRIDNLPIAFTEKEAMRIERLGQAQFRSRVFKAWNGMCAISCVSQKEILRASHIKPWHRCESSAERLDPDNGLLLSPNFDALFDSGLISFRDSGEILISQHLLDSARQLLQVDEAIKLRCALTTQAMAYMAYHRREIFKV